MKRFLSSHFNRFFSICAITFLLSGILCINVFANGHTLSTHTYGIDIPNSGVPGLLGNARVLGECSGGAHDMLAHGWGSIYNVDTQEWVVNNGACAQCTNCYLVIVTEGEPSTGSALGYYTTWQPNEELTSYNTIIRQSSSNIHYTSRSTIDGIRFRYS